MQVNIVFDALAQMAPQYFKGAIQAAAKLLGATFKNNISLNVEVGYGEYPDGRTPEKPGGASAAPSTGVFDSYEQVRSWLAGNADAAAQSGIDALPQTVTIQGQQQVTVWRAQEKLMGQIASNDAGLDGYAGFATNISANSLMGTALHELTHAMGRVNYGTQPDIFDLYRFTSPGTRLFAGDVPNSASYFSLDGGRTDLADYGQASDPSDFLNTGARTPNDPFNEYYDGSTVQGLTSIDLLEMESLGYQANQGTSSIFAIAALSADKPDGLKGTTPYSFEITRSGDLTQATTLTYNVAGSGSSPAQEHLFTLAAGVVNFAAGASAATLVVSVNAAAIWADEEFTVTLAGPPGAILTQATAGGTIQKNETIVPGVHDLALTGTHDQYVIAAASGGQAYIQDTVSGRDGTQAVANLAHIFFADGAGDFDGTGTLENVTRLYRAAFNRAPDLAGLDHNRDLVDANTVPLAALAASFAKSPEFLSLYGSPDNAGFVRQMYQNVLHRAPDGAGLQVWLNYLGTGASQGQVLAGFADSRENRKQILPIAGDKNDSEAARMYQAALNRAPDDLGLSFWSNKLQAGIAPETVAQGFTDSNEFKQLYGTLNATDFVRQLYANVLNRAPDAPGLEFWVGQLNGGATHQHVLIGFSDSTENHIKTASITHDAWVFLG